MSDDVTLPALTAALDALGHPIVLGGPDAEPVFANAAFRRYYGLGAHENLSDARRRLIHPADAPRFARAVQELLEQPNRRHVAEIRLRRRDGGWRLHVASADPVVLADGTRMWVVSYLDVEDYRRQEHRLQQEQDRADAALALIDAAQASAPVGFGFVDREFRYRRLNQALAEIDGLSVEEHLGRPVSEVVPGLWPQLRPLYEHALAGQIIKDVHIVGETVAHPGARREWLATYFPVRVPPRDQVAGVGLVVSEVTEQRDLERRLVQAQKMEAVGYLAGGIAHDFNNVLGVVTLTAQTLLLNAEDPNTRVGLERIVAATRSAAELTRSLLVVARREPSQPRPVDVAESLKALREVIAGALPESIKLHTEPAPGAPPVFIDPTSLDQVLLNLVINARDAMPEGGELWIRVVPRDPDLVALVVTDSGIGMTAEVLERALTPFFTTKQAGSGTGLGLSTVYGIVTSAGGELSITSAPDEGTTVTVLLPRATAEAVAPPSRSGESARGLGELILVVEDQAALRSAVSEVLMSEGYRVVVAADSTEAMSRLDELPDLLLTDVVLPGMTGAELARQVQSISPHTRVLLMSGYPGAVLSSHGADARWPLITKPFTMETLLNAIADQLAEAAQPGG